MPREAECGPQIKRRLLHIKAAPATQAAARAGTWAECGSSRPARAALNWAGCGARTSLNSECSEHGAARTGDTGQAGPHWAAAAAAIRTAGDGDCAPRTGRAGSLVHWLALGWPGLLTHNWASLQLLASVTSTPCHYTTKYTRGNYYHPGSFSVWHCINNITYLFLSVSF